MITLKHADQNFTGVFQLLNNMKKIFLLFFITNSYAQVSDYEEFLRFLPDSVRSSVESRIKTDVENDSDYDQLNQLRRESFMEKEEKPVEYDEFDNVIPSFFGYDLFDIETSFDSSGIIAAPREYVLGPGDEFTISFSGSIQAIKKVSINREGNVFLRELGTISFSGLTFDEASEKLKNITQASLIGTEVEISLSRLRTIQVFVLGNSKRPGSYNFSPLSSISSILFNTKGPNENGSLRNISLKRANKEIGSLDMYDLLINANTSNDLRIQSGDALLVNPVGDRVKIWGNVNRPAIYEIKEGEIFQDVLNFASGLSSKADKNKITLSRLNDQGEREFSDYSLKEINSMKLKDSDEIFIHDLPGKLSNNIRIEGFISNRGVYSYIENSKISDFIDENDLTDKTYLPFSVISRRDDNGSREFIPIDLNLKTREQFNLKPNDFIYVFSQYDIDFINSALLADALGLLSEEDKIKIDIFYEEERKKNQASQEITPSAMALPGQMASNQIQPVKTENEKREEKREEFNLKSKNLTKFIPDDRYPCKSLKYVAKFNASTLISNLKSLKFSTSETNISDRLGLNEGCPKIFEDNPDLLIVALENASLISGEIRKPGFYPITNNISLKNLTSFAGGATNLGKSGNYEIFYSEKDIQNIDFDESENMILSSAFPKSIVLQQDPDKQETFSVSVSGFIKNPGTYSISKGEKLSSLLERAGGYEKNAYPYGGVFTRSTVAKREKEAFNRAADQLEEGIATSLTSGAITNTGNPQLALSVISNLITRLKDISPVGRIVTEMSLEKLKKNPEVDIVLNSGDRIYIPSEKSTITVTGEVLAPTSFVYSKNLRVKDYIKLAGGLADSADKKGIFVILPNGQAVRNLDSWRIGRSKIEPGSTIIVPRDSTPFNAISIFRIFTPILANFATAAAAISALNN
jgi:protein involved in polysaccharide export with SLBB domain